MASVHDFQPGDFLIFQLESGYALLRVLDVDKAEGIWHVAAYRDFFLDPEMVDTALDDPSSLQLDKAHLALTDHAFESTQVARMRNVSLSDGDLDAYHKWKASDARQVHDRSIRLLLGLR